MVGSVDKNTELKTALLYFVDEAIGFRKSVHHYHRWLETSDQYELQQLFIEIGRECFIDFYPLLLGISEADDSKILAALQTLSDYGHGIPPDRLAEALDSFANSQSNFCEIIKVIEILIGTQTLISCVTNSDIAMLGRVLGASYYPSEENHITQLALTIANNPDLNWKDALSRNQIKSKNWLLDIVSKVDIFKKLSLLDSTSMITTLVVGGWVGMIPFLASMRNIKIGRIINVDIDTSVHAASSMLNLPFDDTYINSAEDIRLIDLSKYLKPMVIDTIVEHFEKHGDWIKSLPNGTVVVLQGNNMFDVPDHVNCHKSLEEFLSECGLNTILWSGELSLYKCTRYMAIGKV